MRRACRWCNRGWDAPGRGTLPDPYFCPDCEDKEETWRKIVAKEREYAAHTVSESEPVRGRPQAVEPDGGTKRG